MLTGLLLSLLMTGVQQEINIYDYPKTFIVSECQEDTRYHGVFWYNKKNIQVCKDIPQIERVALHELGHAYASDSWRTYLKGIHSEDFADAFATYFYQIYYGEYLAPRGINKDIMFEIMRKFGNNPEEYVLSTSPIIRKMIENGVVHGGVFRGYI